MNREEIKKHLIELLNKNIELHEDRLKKTGEDIIVAGVSPHNDDFVTILVNGHSIYPSAMISAIMEDFEKESDDTILTILDQISDHIFFHAVSVKDARDKVVAEFDTLKDGVYVSILNENGFFDFKDKAITRDFLDVSLSCSCLYEETEDGYAMLRIDNSILKDLNMSEDEMFELALNNTKAKLDAILFINKKESIRMGFTELGFPDALADEYMDSFDTNVLSEMEKIWETVSKSIPTGAVLCFPEVFAPIAEKEGNDLYVISLDDNTSEMFLVVSEAVIVIPEDVYPFLLKHSYLESDEEKKHCNIYKYSLQDKTIAIL